MNSDSQIDAPARRPSLARRAFRGAASTWIGLALIAAIILYLSAASVFPDRTARLLHAAPEGLYRHALLVGLGGLLCLSVLLATFVRVPLDLPHLGAWCSHLGVFVLAGGAAWFALDSACGTCVVLRQGDGWSAVGEFYLDDADALAVKEDGTEWRQVRLPLNRGRAEEPLSVPLSLSGQDVRATATRYVAWAVLGPAVDVRIGGAGGEKKITLSPGLPTAQEFEGPDYVLMYHPDVAAESLAGLLSTQPAKGLPPVRQDLALIVTGKDFRPVLVTVRPDGSRQHAELKIGEPCMLKLGGKEVRITAERFYQQTLPEAGAEEDAAGPAVAVAIEAGSWNAVTYVPYTPYADLSPAQRIDLPGGKALWLAFGRERRPLGGAVRIVTAQYETYPGSVVPKDYRCEVEIAQGGSTQRAALSLNHPVTVGEYQLTQGFWRPNPRQPMAIMLGVASRPGLPVVWVGLTLIALGMPLAFYLKPFLRRRKGARA